MRVDFIPADTTNYKSVSASIHINVLTHFQKIQQISNMVQRLDLNKGQANSLIVKLNAVTKNMDSGNIKATTNELNAFINKVGADINSGKLSSTKGHPLIDEANDLINAIKSTSNLLAT